MRAAAALTAGALILCACERAAPPDPEAAETAETAEAAKSAPAWSAPAPAPQIAFPAPAGRVVDQADLLTAEQEQALAARQAALERFTSDQIVIVTVDSLQGRDIEDYARELGSHWGVGQADLDNGVLVVVAPNERRVWIAVGRGLEHILSSEAAASIIERDLLPHFRRGDWYRGLDEGERSIALALGSQASTPRGRR